ncbi:hypothetical protein CMK18_22815 [Candidatus Poribacteria bacterium]|nr:hypothetical protein [Candidatus Poribacteria bacterium]
MKWLFSPHKDNRKLVSMGVFLGGFLLTEWLVPNQPHQLFKRLLPAIIAGGMCWIAYPYVAAKMIPSDK